MDTTVSKVAVAVESERSPQWQGRELKGWRHATLSFMGNSLPQTLRPTKINGGKR